MTVPLASNLDTAAAAALHCDLLDRVSRGEPLILDGSAVTRIGQACLQVLASARAAAVTGGLAYRIDAPSKALSSMATLARLDAVLTAA